MTGLSYACLEEQSVTRNGTELKLEFRYQRKSSPIKIYKYVIACSVKVYVTVECCTHSGIYNELTGIWAHDLHDNDSLVYDVNVFSDKLSHSSVVTETKTWFRWTVPETFDLCFKVGAMTAKGKFLNFHNNLELTDFELKGEGGSVRFSKLLLASYSPVFARKFSEEWKEETEGCVDVEGISSEARAISCATLQHLKDYIYTHELPDTGLKELLLLASWCMIPDLQQNCVYKLTNSVTTQEAFELLAFAGQHNLKSLMVSVVDAVDANKMKECILSSNTK